MLRNLFLLSGMILLLLFVAFGVRRSFAQERVTDFDPLDAYISTRMKELGIPGAALVIIQGDHIAHLEAFGVADASGRAVTPQNAFGSLSLGRGAFWQICEFQQGCPLCGMSLRVYEFC